jgi:Cytochrome P450
MQYLAAEGRVTVSAVTVMEVVKGLHRVAREAELLRFLGSTAGMERINGHRTSHRTSIARRVDRVAGIMPGIGFPRVTRWYANSVIVATSSEHTERIPFDRYRLGRKHGRPFAYVRFDSSVKRSGPRVCIGNRFTMMEAKLVPAVAIQRFHFEVAPETAKIASTSRTAPRQWRHRRVDILMSIP